MDIDCNLPLIIFAKHLQSYLNFTKLREWLIYETLNTFHQRLPTFTKICRKAGIF
jgi:hypothetical protein